MKKIAIYVVVFILMINVMYSNKVFATNEEELSADQETAETAIEMTTSSIQATGIVTEVGEIKSIQMDYVTNKVQEVKVEILEGSYETKEFTIDYIFAYEMGEKNNGYALEVGDKVTVRIIEDENGNVTATIQDIVKNTYLIVISVIFLFILIVVARKQAIKTILSLCISIFFIYFILIKGIYLGYHAILMTILTSAIILLLNSILSVGFNKKALIVTLGTFCSIMISGIIAMIFSHLCKFSGTYQDTVAINMNMANVNFYFKDLIFAGIVIASLGICMNVAINLVSKLDEVKDKTEDVSWKELFKIGRNIGSELLGNILNTFILIYVGSSLILIFMFLGCNMEMGEIFNKETIAQNMVSAISGSLGIVFTVLITAMLYAILNHRKTRYKITPDNRLKGNRSLKL